MKTYIASRETPHGVSLAKKERLTFSTRLDGPMAARVLALKEEMKADTSEVLRRVIESGLRKFELEKALNLLREGKITRTKAAELAGVSIYEMIDLAADKGIAINYTKDDLEEDLRTLRNYGK